MALNEKLLDELAQLFCKEHAHHTRMRLLGLALGAVIVLGGGLLTLHLVHNSKSEAAAAAVGIALTLLLLVRDHFRDRYECMNTSRELLDLLRQKKYDRFENEFLKCSRLNWCSQKRIIDIWSEINQQLPSPAIQVDRIEEKKWHIKVYVYPIVLLAVLAAVSAAYLFISGEVKSRLDTLKGQIGDLKTQTAQVRSAVDSIKDSELAGTNLRIDALGDKADGNSKAIDSLKNGVTGLKDMNSRLRNDFDTMSRSHLEKDIAESTEFSHRYSFLKESLDQHVLADTVSMPVIGKMVSDSLMIYKVAADGRIDILRKQVVDSVTRLLNGAVNKKADAADLSDLRSLAASLRADMTLANARAAIAANPSMLKKDYQFLYPFIKSWAMSDTTSRNYAIKIATGPEKKDLQIAVDSAQRIAGNDSLKFDKWVDDPNDMGRATADCIRLLIDAHARMAKGSAVQPKAKP